MPLEAVMVCIDNSDFTRNGDYTPSRFVSQTDAVQLVCSSKTMQNPENSVGLLSTAGERIEVMITPTVDLGKMVSEVAKVKVGGMSDLLRGIQTAQLALKHRQNKNQKQRIVAFVGSPVTATEKELENLGKNLKKNNVSLDLVSFGEVDDNAAKLDKLINAVNSSDTSHVLSVPVGPKMLSDVLLSSPILSDGENAAAMAGMGGGGGGDAGFEFGIDPAQDPELALALRISMEEERARQQAAEGGGAAPAGDAPTGDGAAASPAPANADAGAAPAAVAPAAPLPMASDAAVMEAMDMDDMDEELRQALLLSLQEAGGPPEPTSAPAPAVESAVPPAAEVPKPSEPEPKKDDVVMADVPKAADETAAAPAAASAATEAPAAAEDTGVPVDAQWFQDPSFVSELLGSLPGVDINDPRIQDALKEVGGEQKKDGDDKNEKK